MPPREVIPPLLRLLRDADVQVATSDHDPYSYPKRRLSEPGTTTWLQQVSNCRRPAFTGSETRADVDNLGVRVARLTGELAINAFCRYQHRRNLSAATITHRRFRLMALVRWMDKDILDASTHDLEKFLDLHDLAPQTRYTYTSYLSAFYRWALRERIVRKDPTEQLVKPKLPKRVPRPISDDDLATAVEAADPRMRCFLLLAAFAGARCMEIAGLRVEDIHRDRGVLLLRGKGDKERLVPLHDDVHRALIGYGLPRAGYVFRRSDGHPIKPSTISRYVGRFLRELEIDATAHQGRHSYATALYQLSGGDLRLVQDLLGHASPASTAIYAAWSPERATKVVDLLALKHENEDR